MFAVHTICLLQLSCPLPTGPQTRRTDLDPHVAVVSQRCSTFIAFLVYAFILYLSLNQVHQVSVISMSVPSQALCKKKKTFLSISNLIICTCVTTCMFARGHHMWMYCLTDKLAAFFCNSAVHSLWGLLFYHTHTCAHANMLTRSSVTSKIATGCGLGTKTFSEWSEDAWSQDAPSQNVTNFRCQSRQVQGVDLRRNYVGEMMLKKVQRCRQILQRRFVCLWQPQKPTVL